MFLIFHHISWPYLWPYFWLGQLKLAQPPKKRSWRENTSASVSALRPITSSFEIISFSTTWRQSTVLPIEVGRLCAVGKRWGYHGIIWDYMEVYGSIWDCLRSIKTGSMEHRKPMVTTWVYHRIQRCFCKIFHHLIPSLFTSKSESGPTEPKLFDLTSPFKNGAKHWNINRDRMGCGRFNHQCHGDFSWKNMKHVYIYIITGYMDLKVDGSTQKPKYP